MLNCVFLCSLFLRGCHVVFSVFSSSVQDAVYHTLQSVVDLFREAVGIPLEKKYNSVLFGGIMIWHTYAAVVLFFL